MSNERFVQWLLGEMDRERLAYREIAAKGGISAARISQVVSGEKPGWKFCLGVADGLGKHPIEVFERAGLLTPDPKISPPLRDAMFLFSSLEEETQDIALVLLRALLERQRRVWEALAQG